MIFQVPKTQIQIVKMRGFLVLFVPTTYINTGFGVTYRRKLQQTLGVSRVLGYDRCKKSSSGKAQHGKICRRSLSCGVRRLVIEAYAISRGYNCIAVSFVSSSIFFRSNLVSLTLW